METAAVFIDGGYFENVLRGLSAARINFAKFSDKVVGDKRRLRTYYYHSLPPDPEKLPEYEAERFERQARFFTALNRLENFEVRLGVLVYHGNREDGSPIYQQKGVDVRLAADLLQLSLRNKIQTAYLVAGDGDFVPVVEMVKGEGVQVTLVHGTGYNAYYSGQLWEACDFRVEITNEFAQDCQL